MILGNSVFARCWSFMDSLLMSSLGIISCSMLDSVLILSRVLALPWLLFSQIWRLVVLQIWQNVFGAWQSQDLLAVQPLPSSMNMAHDSGTFTKTVEGLSLFLITRRARRFSPERFFEPLRLDGSQVAPPKQWGHRRRESNGMVGFFDFFRISSEPFWRCWRFNFVWKFIYLHCGSWWQLTNVGKSTVAAKFLSSLGSFACRSIGFQRMSIHRISS